MELQQTPHHVVIIGGGFGGLYAAKALGKTPVKVTLIDKRNFHLFQPLLYQVATGALSPADIASPLRAVVSKNQNTQVLLEEVTDIDTVNKKISFPTGELTYDTLIVATGVSHHYFGNEHWQEIAPGLKTVEDAIQIRHRIFMAFEAAEKELDPVKRKAWLTFTIVGGGPTGVELAGAIAEIAHGVLKDDFRQIDTKETNIILVEGLDRLLPSYPPELSAQATASLTQRGVTVKTKTLVTDIAQDCVTLRQNEQTLQIFSQTVLWAAGVRASTMGKTLAAKAGAQLDRSGRVIVTDNLTIPDYPDLFVIGDLANFSHPEGITLPGIAPVAIQEGKYVAQLIAARLSGKTLPPFQYFDVGSLAVIGQNSAVVNWRYFRLHGFVAWLIWVFAHIYYLIEFDNKLVVMIQWGWNYFTRGRGARLITGERGTGF
jgi:NADH:ubiquinone reductase (H+-translocating)